VAIAATAVAAGCGGGGGEPAKPATPEEVTTSMRRAFPASVTPWRPVGRRLSPVLDADLSVRGSLDGGRVAGVAAEGFWVATGAGGWSIAPRGASRAVARPLARRRVALFANLAEGIDLVVRPTPAGVATFTQFRSGASHSIRWRLALPGDERVARLPKGGAGVFAPSMQLEPRATLRTSPPHNPAASRPGVPPFSDRLGGAYSPRSRDRLAATASAPLALDARGRRVRSSLAVRGDDVTLAVDPGSAPTPVVARVDWIPSGALGNGWFAYGVAAALRRSRYAIEGKRIPGVGCASEEKGELGLDEVQVTRQVAARDSECVSLVEQGTP